MQDGFTSILVCVADIGVANDVLIGRSKYMEMNFLKERLDRIFKLITVDYKVAVAPIKGPKGLTTIIEKK